MESIITKAMGQVLPCFAESKDCIHALFIDDFILASMFMIGFVVVLIVLLWHIKGAKETRRIVLNLKNNFFEYLQKVDRVNFKLKKENYRLTRENERLKQR